MFISLHGSIAFHGALDVGDPSERVPRETGKITWYECSFCKKRWRTVGDKALFLPSPSTTYNPRIAEGKTDNMQICVGFVGMAGINSSWCVRIPTHLNRPLTNELLVA